MFKFETIFYFDNLYIGYKQSWLANGIKIPQLIKNKITLLQGILM